MHEEAKKLVETLNEEKDLWWCPRCKEFTYCPRGSCEAEVIGKIVTKAIIGEFTND